MITIQLLPHTGKWKVTVFDTVIGDNYSNVVQAAFKTYKYLKGQGHGK
jgi:hypothetical protein